MDKKGKGVHKVERSSELGRVHTAEGEFAVRVVDRGGRLEGDSHERGIDQALRESVVGHSRNTRGGIRDQSSCIIICERYC